LVIPTGSETALGDRKNRRCRQFLLRDDS
jgi:hypothetical protein